VGGCILLSDFSDLYPQVFIEHPPSETQGERNMTRVLYAIALAVCLAAGSSAGMAADKDAGKGKAIVIADSVHAKATVVKIDAKARKLTLRNDSGSEFDLVATDDVRNFKQIKKGDVVEVEYHVAVASMLEKASSANVAGQASAVERAPAGAKPGMRAEKTQTIVATVLEVNAKDRLLTAQGPRGNIVTIKVPADMKAFDSLKKGDKISAVMTEMMAVSVKTPEKKK
jgi:Cu/Ag efflux protein CusF